MKILNNGIISQLFFLVVVIAAIIPSAEVFADNSEPVVALITDIKGNIKLKTSMTDKGKPTDILTDLKKNWLIELEKGAYVRIVFYSDNHRATVKGPCLVSITTNQCGIIRGDNNCIREFSAYKGIKTSHSIHVIGEEYAGVSARNKPGSISLYSPLEISSSRIPVFKWQAIAGADKYTISLEDGEGEAIWRKETDAPKIVYDSDAKKSLELGGTYFWEIRALKKNETIARGSGAFKIIEEKVLEELLSLKQEAEKEKHISPDDPTSQIMLMSFCLKNHLLDEASDACQNIIKLRPGEKQPHYWMGRLYELKGMDKEAQSEYKKAGVKP